MQPLASFDLEIAKPVGESPDWKAIRPLGISCAAIAERAEGPTVVQAWSGRPQMSKQQARDLVVELEQWVDAGYYIVTWNGIQLDFDVLAEESGMVGECATLALHYHVDLMFMVFCAKGYYLSLDRACQGMNVPGKRRQVGLSDGRIIEDMNGALAPDLWAAGEEAAVLAYVQDDARCTIELAEAIRRETVLRWLSKAEKPQAVQFPRLATVWECLSWPLPDTSWMSTPTLPGRAREDLVRWALEAAGL